MLPEAYRNGFMIFVWLGLAKLYDAMLGNNNSILYNSDYYRAILTLGIILAVLTILLNLWLIPEFGLNGAAIASFSAFFIYNTLKLVYVKAKFGMVPFTWETVKVTVLLVMIGAGLYFVNFPFHPIIAISVKSLLIMLVYIGIIYRFKISQDVFGVLTRFLRR